METCEVNDLFGKLVPEEPEQRKRFSHQRLDERVFKEFLKFVAYTEARDDPTRYLPFEVPDVKDPKPFTQDELQLLLAFLPQLEKTSTEKCADSYDGIVGKFITDSFRGASLQLQCPYGINRLGLRHGAVHVYDLLYHGEVRQCASAMVAGSIKIEGNCGNAGQHMKGGTLTIAGNATFLGDSLCGGHIAIKGNVEFLASHMSGGSITVDGDVKYVTNLQGGRITINGRVTGEHGLGADMQGGKIQVRSAGKHVGCKMTGGEIWIEETYGSIDRTCKGTIYFRGKPVMIEGKRV